MNKKCLKCIFAKIYIKQRQIILRKWWALITQHVQDSVMPDQDLHTSDEAVDYTSYGKKDVAR